MTRTGADRVRLSLGDKLGILGLMITCMTIVVSSVAYLHNSISGLETRLAAMSARMDSLQADAQRFYTFMDRNR